MAKKIKEIFFVPVWKSEADKKKYLDHPWKMIEDVLGAKLNWREKIRCYFSVTPQLSEAIHKYIYG